MDYWRKNIISQIAAKVDKILVVEMNNGQMLEDVKLAVCGTTPIEFYNRMGGVVPSTDEIVGQVKKNIVQ